MKNYILKSLVITFVLLSLAAHASLYKGLDEEGNTIYSDKPFDDSQTFTLPPLTVMPPTKIPPKKEIVEEEKITETKYSAFTISSPQDQQVIWNEPDVTITLTLKPALNTDEGHRIWLLLDGKTLIKNNDRLSLQIGRLDRGEHQVQAQIRNKKGKVIKHTQPVTIHIKNTFIHKQQNPQ